MTLVELMEREGLKPEKRGNRWWLCCPFHGDTDPSLTVSEKDGGQVWFCYGCKRGGGPAEFLSEMRDVPLFEARKEWALLNGETPPDGERELLTRIIESLPGHEYLINRGIGDEVRERYHVGYCENYEDVLKQWDITDEYARELGLFDFSGCMVYPFYDRDGIYKVAARDVRNKSYRTSPDTSKFFRRGLWGLQRFRGKEAWIFEGYHDVLVAAQAGIPALAAAGTEVTAEGWEELRKAKVERVVFVPDGDAGGRAWLERLSSGAPRGFSMEFVALKSGDPDDAILAGTFSVEPRLNPFEWYVTHKWGSPSSLADRCRMLKDASPVFLRMPAEDRAAARQWFKFAFGDDDALTYLQDGPKRDVEAERVVLANCLYSDSLRLETASRLDESCFTGDINRKAFCLVRDVQATPQLLQVELGMDLSDKADLLNHDRYLDRVESAAKACAVSEVVRTSDPSDVGGIIEDLYRVTDRTTVRSGDEAIREVMRNINARVDSPGALGIDIPSFPTISRAISGLVPGRLVLVSGNSGHGKTTTACNFIECTVDDNPTLMFSLEMSEEDIIQKVVGIRSGVPTIKMMTGSLEQCEYDAVAAAADSLMHGNLQIVTGVTDVHKIIPLARAYVMKKKVRLIYLDYLQLLTMKSDGERWEQLAEISKLLKNELCMKTGATVVGITQLTKQALKSDVPDASDQAGAYAIIAPADAVITCRKMDPEDTKDGSNYVLNVSKNRFGWDDVVIPCTFDRVTQRIREVC